MKKQISAMWNLLGDIIGIVTSRERLKQKLSVSLYRNAIYLMIGTAINSIFGLAFWVVATRWLYEPEDVGLASAVMSAIMLLGLFATLGLDYAVIRFLPNSGEKTNAMVNTCLSIGGLTSIIMALIFMAGLGLWSPALLFLRQNPVYIISFIVFTMCYTIYLIQSRTFIAMRRADFSLAQNIVFNLLRFPFLFILAVFSTVFGIYASWGIGLMVALVIGALVFQPRVKPGYRPVPQIERQVVNELIPYSFANYISALLWSAPGFILPVMVVNLAGAEANAYFFIAWAIAGVLFAVPVGITFSLFAEGSHDEKKLGADTRRSLILILVILIPGILLSILLGHEVLSFFSPVYAENATRVLWVLALSAVPLSLNYIYSGVKRVEMKMESVICLNAFITITTIALSWILLPRMGIMGAGVAWLASQSIAALVVIVLWLPKIRRAF